MRGRARAACEACFRQIKYHYTWLQENNIPRGRTAEEKICEECDMWNFVLIATHYTLLLNQREREKRHSVPIFPGFNPNQIFNMDIDVPDIDFPRRTCREIRQQDRFEQMLNGIANTIDLPVNATIREIHQAQEHQPIVAENIPHEENDQQKKYFEKKEDRPERIQSVNKCKTKN